MFLKRKILIVLFAVLVLTSCQHKLENVLISQSKKDISDVEDGYMYQEIKYAVLETNYNRVKSFINSVNNELKNNAENFKKENASIIRETIKEDTTGRDNMMFTFDNTNIEIKASNKKHMSIKNYVYEDVMGAHPMHYINTYNVDITTGKQIYLNDLVNDLDDMKNYLIKWCKDNEEEMGLYDSYEDTINEYVKNIKELQFYLDSNDIYVIFQVYDIAPYVASEIEIKLPYELK